MAGVLVNVLLERLATLALDKVESELRLVFGVKEDVDNLTSNLEAIQAVLEDAEQRQVTEVHVRRWLKKLEDVSYEMDDVLDEWITRVKKHQWKKQERHNLDFTKKVRASASSFFSASKVGRLNHRRQVANRIKELNKRLARIDEEKQRFNFQSTTKGPEQPERPQTTAFLPEKTFGRVEEKSLILGKMLSEGSGHETSVPLIIPIIGMGGMGKTTLAQLIYNDKSVESLFEKRIWVCVSDPFDGVKIAQAILEGLDKDSSSRNSDKLQTLMQCISELIREKKFLLVLDDVWTPEPSQCEELIKPLRKGATGSRILVTTRKEEVATLMKASSHSIHLNKMSEELCLSLFFYYANVKESDKSEVFQAIGKEIVRKCNGLPLAAKTLGSHMCDKKTIQEWRDVLSSKIWENEEIKEPVFKPLSLSYNDLSPIIKRCLLYSVIFPKDYVYDRDNLIELWMSQDYVDVTGSLGKKYFYTLVRRSFFQDIKVDGYGRTKCKVHDILHDFLQSLAKSEWFINDFEPTVRVGMVMAGDDKIRHLAILQASQSEHLVSFPRCEHLRTLVAFGSPISSNLLASILELKYLRTLNLSSSGIEEIPKEIGGLIHLRYLDLSENRDLKEIIHLSSLYNLQTLRLVDCDDLERVDLRGVTNLRHLVTSASNKVKLIGVDQLTNLRELDQLNVHSDDVQLEVLENLNQHQPILSLRNLGQSNSNEAGKANLVSKEGLRHLGLHFGSDSWTGSNQRQQQNDREILNAIHPPPALESLIIVDYAGNTLRTDWFLSLNNLTSLFLGFCTNCKHLPSLGKLPSLESLQMLEVGVEKLGVEFLGIEEAETPTSSGFLSFPKLKRLRIEWFRQLKEWKGVEELSEEEDDAEKKKKKKKDITIMPCLSSLELYSNRMLPALPDFLWKTPLRQLIILDCPGLGELYRGGEGSENEWAKISHIPNICFDGEWIQGQDEAMGSGN